MLDTGQDIMSFMEANQPSPNSLEALAKLSMNNEYSEIENLCRNKLDNDISTHMHFLGLSYIHKKQMESADHLIRASMVVQSDNRGWWQNYSTTLINCKFYDKAIEISKEGLQIYEDDSILLLNIGKANLELANFSDAKTVFMSIIGIVQNDINANNLYVYYEAVTGLINCHRYNNEFDQAYDLYQVGIAKFANDLQMQINYATFCEFCARYDEAEQYANKVIGCTEPIIDAKARLQVAFCQLRKGNYKKGWDLYRARWITEILKQDIFLFPKLETREQFQPGKRILIHCEQGLGDAIQFARLIPWAARELGVPSLDVLTLPTLRRLFETVEGVGQVYDKVEGYKIDKEYDYQCPLLNLPYLLNLTIKNIPSEGIFNLRETDLLAAKDKIERMVGPGRYRVGLVWAGNPRRENIQLNSIDRQRSMHLSQLYPLGKLRGKVHFVNLQIDNHHYQDEPFTQINNTFNNFMIVNPMTSAMDMYDTACIILNLHYVITVDSAVAHLAASLGVPTLMLSRKAGCWRWMDQTFSPWYRSMIIFQQKNFGEWRPVVEEIAEWLNNRID